MSKTNMTYEDEIKPGMYDEEPEEELNIDEDFDGEGNITLEVDEHPRKTFISKFVEDIVEPLENIKANF